MTAAEAKAAIKSMKRKMEDKNTSSKKTKVEAAPVNGMVSINAFYFLHYTSVSDPDPYHLAGSGSASGNVDLDPDQKKS